MHDCAADYDVRYPASAPIGIVVRDTNGNVVIMGARSELDVVTENGNIDAALADGWTGASIGLHTSEGNIRLRVPAGFPANLRANTTDGVVTDTIGSYGGAITIAATTRDGNITIERRDHTAFKY